MYKDKITPANKRMKNGKTHPWRARVGTSREQKRDINNREVTIPFNHTMGIKR